MKSNLIIYNVLKRVSLLLSDLTNTSLSCYAIKHNSNLDIDSSQRVQLLRTEHPLVVMCVTKLYKTKLMLSSFSDLCLLHVQIQRYVITSNLISFYFFCFSNNDERITISKNSGFLSILKWISSIIVDCTHWYLICYKYMQKGRHGRDYMIDKFTSTYTFTVYHNYSEVYSIQHYVLQFVGV